MTDVKLDMHAWAKWMDELGDRFLPAVLRGTESGALRCAALMQQRTMTAPPASPRGTTGAFDTGLYKAAWKAERMPTGSRIYNSRPQAGVIDYGRRPRPVGPSGRRNIAAWAYRKLKLSKDEAEKAAWAIAQKQSKTPLLPRKVMSGAQQTMEKIVSDEIDYELDKELGR